MYNYIATAGTAALYKRFSDGNPDDGNPPNYQLPGWAWMVVLADFVVFFPVVLYLGYTLNHIYPVLAMVEDPKPPAYEPVSLNADTESLAEDNAAQASSQTKADSSSQGALVTSSLRRINRLLFSTAGWTANFRGLSCAIALSLANGVAAGIFSAIPFVPSFVGTLLASLATVQLSTVWTHAVISAPNPLPWYRRLPPLRRTFEATCAPVTVYWAAMTVASAAPLVVASAMGMPVWDPKRPMEVPAYQGSSAWQSIVVLLVSLAVQVLLVIPARVLLVRVQASLLPPEEDTIVPFDRSFEGAVEPALVGGKGYVSMKDAIRTFPAASWRRLYLLFAKVLGVTMAAYLAMSAIIIPEVILMVKKSTPAV